MRPPRSFSVSDTVLCKGVAICLVVYHHLFYPTRAFGTVAQEVALISKAAVALFVFLSGFGLYRSHGQRRRRGIGSFYISRLRRLYVPYWLAWILFVPPGILFFHRSFESVYKTDVLLRVLENFFGVHQYFGFFGYNPTWWFVSLILGLYALFPLFVNLVNRLRLAAVVLSLGFLLIPVTSDFWFLTIYLFPFVLGMYVARDHVIEKYAGFMSGRRLLKLFIYLSVLGVLIWQRQAGMFQPVTRPDSAAIDGIVSFLLVVICFEYLGNIAPLRAVLVFVGRHAYNIFLIHTFIYYLYFRDVIYSLDYASLIFAAVLGSSLLVSMFMERLMRMARLG